jgi:hypothetical protein
MEELNERKEIEEMKEREECINRDIKKKDANARAERKNRDMTQNVEALKA